MIIWLNLITERNCLMRSQLVSDGSTHNSEITLNKIPKAIPETIKLWVLLTYPNSSSHFANLLYTRFSSLWDWDSTFPADFAKINVSRNPTIKSGIAVPVMNTKPAAASTEVFAMISLREQSHTEDILMLSFLCIVRRNRQKSSELLFSRLLLA